MARLEFAKKVRAGAFFLQSPLAFTIAVEKALPSTQSLVNNKGTSRQVSWLLKQCAVSFPISA